MKELLFSLVELNIFSYDKIVISIGSFELFFFVDEKKNIIHSFSVNLIDTKQLFIQQKFLLLLLVLAKRVIFFDCNTTIIIVVR
jgi:hypothetical protein